MLASDATTFGWMIFGFVLAVLVLVGLGRLIRSGKIRAVSVNAGPVHANVDMTDIKSQLEKISKGVDEIGDTVNHRREGEPTLVETINCIDSRLKTVEGFQGYEREVLGWQNDLLAKIAHHVGFRQVHENPPPTPPQGAHP